MTETAVQGDQPLIIEPGPNVANKAVGIVIDNPETFESDSGRRKKSRRRGKKLRENFSILRADEEQQKGMLGACKKEWAKWQLFNAAENISNKQRSSYGKGIHVYHYSKAWAETDKNEPLRTPGKYVEPLYKAKRVTSGDLEQTPGATHLRVILKVKTFYSHSHQAKMRSIIT